MVQVYGSPEGHRIQVRSSFQSLLAVRLEILTVQLLDAGKAFGSLVKHLTGAVGT